MPAARRPMTHQAVHRAGERDALTGDLDAVARVTLEQGQTSFSRRKIAVTTTGGITASIADDVQNERVTLTLGAPTETRNIRAFVSAVGAATTAAGATDFTILVNPAAAAATVTLPAAASNTGRIYVVKRSATSANSVTIDPANAELIDGAATLVLTTRQGATIQCDGVGWYIIGRG